MANRRMRRRRRRLQQRVNSHLLPELLMEILARLPAKKLLEFRSVCRNWCSLIDSREFIALHMKLSPNKSANTQLLTTEYDESVGGESVEAFVLRRIDSFSRIDYLWKPHFKLIYRKTCMVHGLIAVSNSECFMLCNPSIRKFFTIPRCPLKSTPFLGYSASNDDFKLVAFDFMDSVPFGVAIVVYSLRGLSWRVYRKQVTEKCISVLRKESPKNVYFKGAVYWMPASVGGQAVDTELMCFDFEAEKFGFLKLPDIDKDMKRLPFILGGSLAVFGISSVRSCIWVLEKNTRNESWRRCWSNNTSEDVYKFFHSYSHINCDNYQMWYIQETGTLLFYKSSSDELMAYNIRSSDIPIQYLGKEVRFRFVDIYTESLVLHNRYDGAAVQNG